jgi:hypothetical protein
MPRQILAPAILVSLLAMLLLTPRYDRALAAEECAAAPGATAPPGSHWYYRLDRATHAHCWYLGPQGAKVVPAATHAASSVVRLPIARPPILDGESAYASADPAVMTAQHKPREGEAGPTFAMRWLNSPASPGALAFTSVGVDTTASPTWPADASEADRGISPSREADDYDSRVARVARPFALMLAALVTGLASVGVTEAAIFRRAARRQGSSTRLVDRRRRTDDRGQTTEDRISRA